MALRVVAPVAPRHVQRVRRRAGLEARHARQLVGQRELAGVVERHDGDRDGGVEGNVGGVVVHDVTRVVRVDGVVGRLARRHVGLDGGPRGHAQAACERDGGKDHDERGGGDRDAPARERSTAHAHLRAGGKGSLTHLRLGREAPRRGVGKLGCVQSVCICIQRGAPACILHTIVAMPMEASEPPKVEKTLPQRRSRKRVVVAKVCAPRGVSGAAWSCPCGRCAQ